MPPNKFNRKNVMWFGRSILPLIWYMNVFLSSNRGYRYKIDSEQNYQWYLPFLKKKKVRKLESTILFVFSETLTTEHT